MNVPPRFRDLLLILTLVSLASTQAANLTWVVASGSTPPQDGGGTWDTSLTNWYTGGANTTWTSSGTAVIGSGGTAGTINLGVAISASGLIFNTVTGTYTIGSTGNNELTLLGPTITVNDDAAVISTRIGGSAGLTKSGTGTLYLTSGNSYSYTGATTVGSGTLMVNGNGSLQSNNFIIGNGSGAATLQFNTVTFLSSSTITVNNQGTLGLGIDMNPGGQGLTGLVVNNGGNITAASARTLTMSNSGTLIINDGADLSSSNVTFSFNAASGNTVVSFAGSGTDASNIAANFTLGSGGATRAFSVADVVSGTGVDAIISGSIFGTGAVTKTGLGTLRLSGSNSYTGNTTVSVGTLQLGHANALGTTANGTTVSGSATLDLNGQTVGAEAITISGTGFGGNGTLVNSNTGTSASLSGNVTLSGASRVGGDGNMALSGTISGANDLNKIGTGTLALSGNNTFSGTLSIRAGAVSIATINNASSNGTLGNNANSMVMGDSGATGTLQYTGATASSTKRFTMASSGTGVFDVSTAATNLTLSGTIDGSGGLTKVGSGTLTLSAANTYTGLTTISAGALVYGASNVIASGGVTVDGANAVLALGANSDTVGTVTVDGGGSITGGGTLTSTGSFELKSGSVAAILAGSGIGLNKTTSGTATISGANAYTGLTDVQAGKLLYGASNAIASGNVQVSGGILDLSTFSDTVGTVILANGSIIGSGTLTGSSFDVRNGLVSASLGGSGIALAKTTTGTVTLSTANAYTGATTVTAGTLIVGTAGSLASSGVTVGTDGKFVYNNNTTAYAGNVAVDGVLEGSGKLGGIISGSGQVNPGNSPGILTAGQVNPGGGLDFAFEFTSTGMPTYGNNTASVNDVLRITDTSSPFLALLNSSNTIKIYLNGPIPTFGDIFYGGFYTDRSASFLSSIIGAAYEYYVFNGSSYDAYSGPLTFDVNTVAQTANFGAGDVSGFVMEISAVPEPSTCAFLGLGLTMLASGVRRRRNGA